MSFQQKLVEVTVAEWEWFGKDVEDGTDNKIEIIVGGSKKKVNKEAAEPYAKRVGDYWLAIPTKDYDSLVKAYAKSLGKLDGTVTNLPWSAAFISYCFNTAGAGTQFPYKAGHWRWINLAIKNRRDEKTSAPLYAFKLGETAVSIGDVFGKARESPGLTFENAPEYLHPTKQDPVAGVYTSHSDIVTEVDIPNRKAYLIGGNVEQTVAKREIRIDKDGKPVGGTGGYFVHIRNQITTPELAFTPIVDGPLAG